MTAVITLLSDFGLQDPYVGIMKAVMLERAPAVRLVDLTHEIEPQNILQGAFLLASAVPYCPPATVHLAVVDPGVGTERNAIVVQTHRARYVAPDNGLLTLALSIDPPIGAWRLNRPQFFLPQVSATFQGRDVFAPIAAHLATGRAAADMGEPMDPTDLIRLPLTEASRDGSCVHAQVLHVDRFGNAILNLHHGAVTPLVVTHARAGRVEAPLQKAYRAVAPGEFLCIWGSSGYLELSRCMGSAAAAADLAVGQAVDVFVEEGTPSS